MIELGMVDGEIGIIRGRNKGEAITERDMILVDEVGHMVSTDSAGNLHAFACRLGLKRRWYQTTHHPHYDLTTIRMKRKAISMGAKKVTSCEVIRLAWWQKGKG